VPIVKKIVLCLILTILFALSISATSLHIRLYGKAITKDPKTKFYLSIKGIKDSITNIENPSKTVSDSVNIHDSIYADTLIEIIRAARCLVSVNIKKIGFLFDSLQIGSVTDTIKCDSFSWSSGDSFSEDNYQISSVVIEKKPKITTKLSYSNSLLQWKTHDSTIIDSQSLWASYNQGSTYKRIDTISLTSTQRSYPWITLPGTVIFKIKTTNADSSDSSFDTLSTTNIKNRIIINFNPQKTSSTIFNVQGQLVYKGSINSRFPKLSTGEYFTINKIQLLLR
jgi:hypothetical protein